MTLGDYHLGWRLPAREASLSPTMYARYVTSAEHYLLPHLGARRTQPASADQFAALYREHRQGCRGNVEEIGYEHPNVNPRRQMESTRFESTTRSAVTARDCRRGQLFGLAP
jgi:hypothetical protein